MSYYTINKTEQRKDKLKSGIITAIVWTAIFLFFFMYTVKVSFPVEKEAVSTMLINFGDHQNGQGEEEPEKQDRSMKTVTSKAEPKSIIEPKPEPKPQGIKAIEKETVNKILTGNSAKITVKKTEKSKKSTDKNTTAKTKKITQNTKTNTSTSNSKSKNENGKGNTAIGNLIRGRGSKANSQGTNAGMGNTGDPLGGDGNGNSRIGIDRKLIGFIPGTMGRGGTQPSHKCSARGSITISYIVDKAGNVVSAKRSAGISDPCIINTTTAWVKKYVKAEKSNVSSTGSYKITF